MMPDCWPTWLDGVWAKSAGKGEGGEPETLAQHTWNVLSRLADFIYLRPDLPGQLSAPRLWHVLFWSSFLHDFGKAAGGFQNMLHGGDPWRHRHEVLSLAFLDWIASDFSDEERLWLVAAIVSHHRDAEDIHDLYYPADDPEDDQLVDVVADLDIGTTEGMWHWLHECSPNWLDELGLRRVNVTDVSVMSMEEAVSIVHKDGVGRINYWLKAYRYFYRALDRSTDVVEIIGTLTLRGVITNADHSASAHAGKLPVLSIERQTVLDSRGLSENRLFRHQQISGTVVGSALLIAPTGSGKTEAALLWAANQAAKGNAIPRLFYTLPYQASMNAMKIRLSETFGEQNVGLQHGRALMALYRMLLEREYDPRSAANTARWARNLAQLNYPPIRVFSPYQMLKGVYRLKGYEARLTDYHNALFIFDEIHAYEVGRLAMILETVRYLNLHYNARFFVMSATFPSLIKNWLCDALGEVPTVSAGAELFAQFVRHKLSLLDGELVDTENLNLIAETALAGSSVLVVCNLVDRAQAVFDSLNHALSEHQIEVHLLHGRFNMRDRSAKEALVRETTGAKSQQRRPIVLVATQVVEVSLDIDLDTIFTEPAPLEALVQRFGRINRGRKMKEPARVHVFRTPDDGQGIYDTELVCRTLDILDANDSRPIDEGRIGGWLDQIYAGSIALRWSNEYEKAAREFRATVISPLRAFQSDDDLEELFYKAFDSVDVLPISLYDEYEQLNRTEPIRASELLVSISWRRWHALARDGLILPREKRQPYVVNVPYTSELGMYFGV